jgi:hypothetical protein
MLEFIMGLITATTVYVCVNKGNKKKRKPRLLLLLSTNDIKIKGDIMAISLTSTQFVEGVLQPVDRKGRPAKVQPGSIDYSSSDENVFTVTEDPNDETKLIITAVGEGTGQLDYSADADLGDGVVTISGFTAVEVLPASAVGFGLVVGTPQEQDLSGTTTSTTTL